MSSCSASSPPLVGGLEPTVREHQLHTWHSCCIFTLHTRLWVAHLKTKKETITLSRDRHCMIFGVRHVADVFYFWSTAVIYEPQIHLPPASQKKKKKEIDSFCTAAYWQRGCQWDIKEGVRFSKKDHTSGVSETPSIPPNVTASIFICCTLSIVLYVFILPRLPVRRVVGVVPRLAPLKTSSCVWKLV